MVMEIDREKEEAEFNAWLDSIHFMDEEGNIIAPKLVEDTSYDPEYDRGEPSEEELIEEEEEEEEE